jgi:hypothetical protein
MTSNASTPKTRVRRHPERASYDTAVVHAILDAAYVAHVGVIVDGSPVVLPYACARVGDELVLHGSTKAGILSAVATGTPICATVTHLDGLVLARSAFESSMNYRSVVVQGFARVVVDRDEKVRLLDAFVDRVLPGRRAQIRGMTDVELQVTQVVAVHLDAVSAKVRTGPPKEPKEDHQPDVWGGVIPLTLAHGNPEPDDVTSNDAPAPHFVEHRPAPH